jgi:hypothetical protein
VRLKSHSNLVAVAADAAHLEDLAHALEVHLGLRTRLVHLEDVLLNAAHDVISPPASVQIEPRRESVLAAQSRERTAARERIQLVRACENVEEWSADGDVRIQRRRGNRRRVGFNREGKSVTIFPKRHGFGELETAFETRHANRTDARGSSPRRHCRRLRSQRRIVRRCRMQCR